MVRQEQRGKPTDPPVKRGYSCQPGETELNEQLSRLCVPPRTRGRPPKTWKIINQSQKEIPQQRSENNWEPIIQTRRVHVLPQLRTWSYQGPPTRTEFTSCANLVCHDSHCVLLVTGAWQHEVSKRYSRTVFALNNTIAHEAKLFVCFNWEVWFKWKSSVWLWNSILHQACWVHAVNHERICFLQRHKEM